MKRKIDKEKIEQLDEIVDEMEEDGEVSSGENTGEGVPLLLEEDIQLVCEDLISLPFDIWGVFNENVKPLTEEEKRKAGKLLARVIVKHQLQSLVNEEMNLLIYLLFLISRRWRKRETEALTET